ncbi:HAD-IA family hydrolase [Pseudonocardia xinjiangensis]|nr:HAD-IA family hydrolase [Pseudonocardia xinjiangensis]
MPLRGLLMDYAGVLTDGPDLLALVERARLAGVATALVSDAHEMPGECAALFDAMVLGPALGARKPDPEVFRRAAELLGLPVGECVVVDDQIGNIRGARAAGAVVVHHRDAATTAAEIEILLDLPPA